MALKASGTGQFLIPTAPAVGTTVAGGAANTFTTNYVQLIASTSAAIYIVGIHIQLSSTSKPTYVAVRLATGANPNETIVGEFVIPYAYTAGATGTQMMGYIPLTIPIAVANATRISAKTADSVGSLSHTVILECINQSNVVDAGINESSNVTQWNGTNVSSPATAGIPDVNVKNINNVVAATPGASGGILISGSNAGTTTLAAFTVTGKFLVSDGLEVNAATTDRPAVKLTGNGTGAGLRTVGGATNASGLEALGNSSGSGAVFTGGSGGTAAGVKIATNNPNTHFVKIVDNNGPFGIVITSPYNGLYVDAEYYGVTLQSAQRCAMEILGGDSGFSTPALSITSRAVNGTAIEITGAGTGDGIHIEAGTTGKDINLAGSGTIEGDLNGTINGLTATALKDFFDTDSGTTAASAVAGSVVKEIVDNAGGASLTVQDIVDGVWDEDATGHQTQGSFGQVLGDSGADTDSIWALTNSNLDAAVSSRLAPTTAGRTLDVTATGAAGIDWANVENQGTTVGLSATTIKTATDVETDTQDIQSRLPAALTAGGNMKSDTLKIEGSDATDQIRDSVVSDATRFAGADIAAIKAKTDNLPTDPADQSLIIAATDAIAALIGTPVGADISADIAAVKGDTAQIKSDLPVRITKNVALANFPFFMADSSDHVSGKTGLTVTAERRIDNGSFASCANSVTEVANGWYTVDLAATDLNGNTIALKFTATGADPTNVTIVTEPT